MINEKDIGESLAHDSEKSRQRLLLMRGAARVARMHTMPTARTQTVGEHTFGYLAILDHVMDGQQVSTHMWRAALYHDSPEFLTGDTPSTAKWASSALERELSELEEVIQRKYGLPSKLMLSIYEQRVLKFCDLMELGIFCLEEHWMGDYRMRAVCERVIEAVKRRGLERLTENGEMLFVDFVHDVLGNTKLLSNVQLRDQ